MPRLETRALRASGQGMYFGRAGDHRSLEVVEAFIMGYQFGVEGADNTLPFTHFTRWVAAHYRVN